MLMNGGGTTLDVNPELDPARTHFIDLNGNGRADWIYIQSDTRMDISINQRGDRTDGKGLRPHWLNAMTSIEGWPQTSVITDEILFGWAFGSGHNDVVLMQQLGTGNFDYVFKFYRNTGGGGTELRGDSMRYCDMLGRGYDK
jgi:hypothetical protein